MEQLHAEGLMKGEDGSGGPIDPNDMWDFWHKNSWHSKNEGQYWGGQAVSGALGFVPWVGLPLSFGADYLMDQQVNNKSLIDVIRHRAIDYKDTTLNQRLDSGDNESEYQGEEEPESEDENNYQNE
jgi:hypothetical protein